MNKMKKFLAGLLALVMILSLVPMSALAAEECDHANAYYIDSWGMWRCDECSTWHSKDPRPVEEPEEEPAEECTHANAVYVEPWDMWHCDDCSSWFEEDPRAAEEPEEEPAEECTHANAVYVEPWDMWHCDDCSSWFEEDPRAAEEPAEPEIPEEPVVPEEPEVEEPEETECEHDFTWKLVATTTVAKEGDCEHATEYYYSCKKCEALDLEHTFTVSLPAGHQWDEGEVTKEATCEEEGEVTYTCTVCESTKTEPIEATGHDFTWKLVATTTVAKEADCENAAEYYYSCRNCEALDKEHTFTIGEPLKHDWDEGEVTTPATCITEGVMTYTCKNDANHTYTDVIPVDEDAHTDVTVTLNVSEQYTGDICCSGCNDVLIPGCTLIKVEAKEATCVDKGQIEHLYCEKDGVCYLYENGHHTVIKDVTTPVDEDKHDMDEGEITTPATCIDKGIKTYTCKRGCGHTVTEDVEIDPENHTGETVTKNQSETYSGDIHCADCNALLKEGEIIAVPSTPITPAKPTWKNWLDKVINNWKDKIECPEEPTEPEETIPEETVPEETEPEETVPAAPVTPAKPNWGSIIRGCWNWIFR